MRRVSVIASFVVLAVTGIAGCSDVQDDVVSVDVQASVDTDSVKPTVALTSPVNQWQWFNIPGTECGNGTQTGVAVSKGTGTDIVVWMQGGGMCWDELSCKFKLGEWSLVINYKDFGQTQWNQNQAWLNQYGILNRNDATNPYKNSTFVFVPYCTGDFHSGNTTQTWSDGFTMKYSGRKNLTQDIAQIVGSFPNPSRVTVYGESAGAFGATLNFFRFKNAYPNKRVDLIGDSGPYIPQAAPVVIGGPVWGLNSAWPAGCTTCASDFTKIYNYNATTYPTSRFGYLNYDQDLIVTFGALIDPYAFYGRLKGLQLGSMQPLSNVRYFAPGGFKHGVARDGMQLAVNTKTLGTWLGEMVADSTSWNSQASWGTTCGGSSIAIGGDIGAKFVELGACEGVLGKPTKGVTGGLNYGGSWAEFTNNTTKGAIIHHPAHGAHEIHGPILDQWVNMGGANGTYGYPVTDVQRSAVCGGATSAFERGIIYYSVANGARGVTNTTPVGQKYFSMGGDGSFLGLPTSEEYSTGNFYFDRRQNFEHGHIYWSTFGGAVANNWL